MVCTYCSSETQVVNSRLQKRANSVWRRRKCMACNRVFSTIEQVDYEKSWVVQYADGSSKEFVRDKLLMSIHHVLQHRPTALPDALGLVHTIVGKLGSSGLVQDGSVTSTGIATLCLDTLTKFDKAAATMYAAYHQDVL